MLMKNYLILLFIIIYFPLNAQSQAGDTAILKGRIAGAGGLNEPAVFEVCLPKLRLRTLTDPDGRFVLQHIPYGNYLFIAGNGMPGYDSFRIAVDMDTTDLGILQVNRSGRNIQESDLLLTEIMPDITTDGQEMTVMSPDPANPMDGGVRAWSASGYRFRGYDRNRTEMYLNGYNMQDMENGTLSRGLWAALSGLRLSSSVIYGQQPADVGYGGLAATVSLEATAAGQPPQTRIAYSRSNGIWSDRILLSYSTGMLRSGWGFTWSAGKRWSGQGYVPGTYYEEYSCYLGISRKAGALGLLHFTALAAPVESGNTSATVAEATDLAGSTYYNPNWGYQDGIIRNSKISKTLQPAFLLNYVYKTDSNTAVYLAAIYRFGYNSRSAIDWYNAQDPRPDYYKNLPDAYKDDPVTAAMIREEWLHNPARQQLDWQRMYEANRMNGDTLNRHPSAYVLGADRDDMRQYGFNVRFRRKREQLILSAGLSYEAEYTAHYRELLDLLGGDYYRNVNQYAEQAYAGNTIFSQNDLNQPDRAVFAGDKYSYDYIARIQQAAVWSQALLTYHKVGICLAGRLGYDAFNREGRYRTGMYPTDSYGRSASQHFFTYQARAGLNYTFHAQHQLFLNGNTGTTAPLFDHTFIAPRNRNTTVGKAVAEKNFGIEGGYILKGRRIKGNFSGYIAESRDGTDIRRFYHEDYRSFVNYVMQGISIQRIGAEFAIEARIMKFLTVTAAASWMQVQYHSRPVVSIYKDNDTSGKTDRHIAYLKDYYLAGPQSAAMLGLHFNLPRFAYAGILCRLLDRNYTDINPARRTDAALGLTVPGSPEALRILQQERLPQVFMIDLSAGKTFYLYKTSKHIPGHTALYIRAGISNLLNNKNSIISAYEQLRFDYKGHDPDRFPNKYSYAYGGVYTVELGLKF
jgi:hypothetical protein